MSDAVAADQLRMHIEAIERLEEEKKGIADDIKDRFALAKSDGFDTKTIREIIKLRKLEPEARREREALLDTYKAALGMLDGTPLGKWAVERLTKPAEDVTSPAEHAARYEEAVQAVRESRNASASWLQRHLRIGYNPAAWLIERMEQEGVVSRPDHVGRREVLPVAGEAPTEEVAVAAPEPEPEPTIEDAHRMGGEAAQSGAPVTANPFPAYDERRAAWDEAWCAALGSDGMDIPDALKPTPKPKKNNAAPADPKPDDAA